MFGKHALLPIQVSREISQTEKLLFGFDLAPTLIPGWCWSKFLMQPVFLGERGERKVSHGLLMESPALKLELSTTKNASVELLFEISILIKIQPRPHANCNLEILSHFYF